MSFLFCFIFIFRYLNFRSKNRPIRLCPAGIYSNFSFSVVVNYCRFCSFLSNMKQTHAESLLQSINYSLIFVLKVYLYYSQSTVSPEWLLKITCSRQIFSCSHDTFQLCFESLWLQSSTVRFYSTVFEFVSHTFQCLGFRPTVVRDDIQVL